MVRLPRSLPVAAFALVAVFHQPLSAQTVQPLEEPRVEVGVSGVIIGGYLDVADIGELLVAPGASVRINIGERAALEMSGIFPRGDDVARQLYGASVIIKQRGPEGWTLFARLGAGGQHEVSHFREFRHENQDGSITVFPAYDRHKVTALNFVVAGMAVQKVISRRLAYTVELDGVVGLGGVGFFASGGVVIPLGSYRPR